MSEAPGRHARKKRLYTTRLKITDGGKSSSKRPKQDKNCTVVAVAIATGVSYDTAYEHLRSLGRQSNRGFDIRIYASDQDKHLTALPIEYTGQTVPEFLHEFRHGSWLVEIQKHVFAVVNGVVHDHSAPDPQSRVVRAWLIGTHPEDYTWERPYIWTRYVLIERQENPGYPRAYPKAY